MSTKHVHNRVDQCPDMLTAVFNWWRKYAMFTLNPTPPAGTEQRNTMTCLNNHKQHLSPYTSHSKKNKNNSMG